MKRPKRVQQAPTLLDHLVGARKQRGWHCQAERFGSFEVNQFDENLEGERDVYLEGGDDRTLIHLTGQQFHDMMRDAPTATFAEKPNWGPRIQRRSRKAGYPDILYITGADCICGTLDT
jgi:hypothetical protein